MALKTLNIWIEALLIVVSILIVHIQIVPFLFKLSRQATSTKSAILLILRAPTLLGR